MDFLQLIALAVPPVTTENPLPVVAVTAEISDTVWLALILCVQTITLALIQFKTKKVIDETHTLVNNAMTIQLEINRTLSQRLVEENPSSENRVAADRAEEVYRKHISKDAK